MILDLLGHKDYLRILIALEGAPQRFTEIQKSLDLNPAQVDRALAFLRKGLWVVPRTLPAESGPLRVEYRLGKRGAGKCHAGYHQQQFGESKPHEGLLFCRRFVVERRLWGGG